MRSRSSRLTRSAKSWYSSLMVWERIPVARATGIRSQTINELYHDFAERVSLDDLDLICEALDCELDDLIVREPNPERRVKEVRHIPQTVNKSRKK